MAHRTSLVVGSYAPAGAPGIVALEVDVDAGRLVRIGARSGVENPSFVAPDPAGGVVFVVSETAPGRVHSFAVDRGPDGVRLADRSDRASEGDHPCHLAVAPSGRWLVVSNYGSGCLAVLPIHPSGSLGAATTVAQHAGEGPRVDRQAAPHAHSATFTPDGRHVVAADLGADLVRVYRFDDESGSLDRVHDADVAPGAGPRHVAVHPDGQRVFVANELDNTVSSYRRDGSSGELVRLRTIETVPPDVADNLVADAHLTPDSHRLIVSNRGHDTLAEFAVDPELRRVGCYPCGGRWPRNFAVLPDGEHVVVANERSDQVVLVGPGTDGERRAIAAEPIPAPSCVVAVPD